MHDFACVRFCGQLCAPLASTAVAALGNVYSTVQLKLCFIRATTELNRVYVNDRQMIAKIAFIHALHIAVV